MAALVQEESEYDYCSLMVALVTKSPPASLLQAQQLEWDQWKALNVSKTVKKELALMLEAQGKAICFRGKWVAHQKINDDGLSYFKARLVAQGFKDRRRQGEVDSNSPVLTEESLRLLLASCDINSEVWLLDVKTAYLNAPSGESVAYLMFPPTMIDGSKLCKDNEALWLLKAVYGTRDASCLWYCHFTKKCLEVGLTASKLDPCLFLPKSSDGHTDSQGCGVIVDDILCKGGMVHSALRSLPFKFGRDIKVEVGTTFSFKGLSITRTKDGFHLDAKDKITKLEVPLATNKDFKSFLPTDLSPIEAPVLSEELHTKFRSLVYSLAWICSNVEYRMSFPINFLSRFAHQPTEQHFKFLSRVLECAKVHCHGIDIAYRTDLGDLTLDVFADASWAPRHAEFKSTGGWLIKLGQSPISWKTRTIKGYPKSSMAAELKACIDALDEASFIQSLLQELTGCSLKIHLYTDSRCVVDSINVRSKTIPRDRSLALSTASLREIIDSGKASVIFVRSECNPADELTKSKLL